MEALAWRHMEAFRTENKEGPGNRTGNFQQLKEAKREKCGLIPQTLEAVRSPRGQPQQGQAQGEHDWEQTQDEEWL